MFFLEFHKAQYLDLCCYSSTSTTFHQTLRLFVDNTIVYRKVQTETDADILQGDLDVLQKWASTWLMEFTVEKCQLFRVTNKRKPIQRNYTLNGKQLPVVDSAKYFGVTVDHKLLRNEHINSICRKANGALAFLRRNMSGCSAQMKTRCYQSMVRPIMEYGSTVWDPHTENSIHQLEMVQRRAARFVSRQNSWNLSVTPMLQALRWTS